MDSVAAQLAETIRYLQEGLTKFGLDITVGQLIDQYQEEKKAFDPKEIPKWGDYGALSGDRLLTIFKSTWQWITENEVEEVTMIPKWEHIVAEATKTLPKNSIESQFNETTRCDTLLGIGKATLVLENMMTSLKFVNTGQVMQRQETAVVTSGSGGSITLHQPIRMDRSADIYTGKLNTLIIYKFDRN